MRSRRLALFTACLSLAGIGGTAALTPVASAKRAQCVATPVPDQPGTYIVTCSTNRP